MEKSRKILYISTGLICLFFVISLFQIKGYFLNAYESKYVTSAAFTNSFLDILKADINGINVFDGGPLYFLIIKIFVKIFGVASEFVVRLPSVLISFATVIFFYLFCQKFTTRYYLIISVLVFCLNASFMTFSSISVPQIMASDFALISVLFGCYPLFSKNNDNEHLFFTGFWLFTFLVVFTDLFTAVVPFIVVLISYLIQRKFMHLLKPVNFIFGLFSVFLILYNWQILSYKVSENIPLFEYFVNSENIQIQPYLYLKYFIGLLAGLMPWSIIFVSLFALIFSTFKKIKNVNIDEISAENKLLLISVTGFLTSSFVFFLNHSFSNVILATSFASVCIGYFWYKHIIEDKYNGIINFSSAFFYCITLLFTVSVIVVYFFIDISFKFYFEPLLIPLIIITLLVSIPGLILIMLNIKWVNFSVHLIFSVVFYFILTGVLFDYFNSFGESELITYAYGARDSVSKLATYDLKNKYVIPYYFGNIVEFNDKLSPSDIYQKYGDTYDIRLIMRIKSLEDFDGNFVYELLGSGKNYCVITNIKMLPSEYTNDTNETKSNS